MKILNESDVYHCFSHLNDETIEKAYLAEVDLNMEIASVTLIGSGNEDAVLINRKLAGQAIIDAKSNHGIFLIHNHPSDGAEPSKDDQELTDTIEEMVSLFGRQFLDHIIVSKNEFYSFTTGVLTKYVSSDQECEGTRGGAGDNNASLCQAESREDDFFDHPTG